MHTHPGSSVGIYVQRLNGFYSQTYELINVERKSCNKTSIGVSTSSGRQNVKSDYTRRFTFKFRCERKKKNAYFTETDLFSHVQNKEK